MTVDNVVMDALWTTGLVVKRTPGASVTVTDSGAAYGVRKWPYSLRGYEIPFKNMPNSEFSAMLDFFDLQGLDRGFLIWGIDGYYLSGQSIGTGDGSTTQFQIARSVSNGVTSFNRTIYHPVPTGTAIPAHLQGLGSPVGGNAANTVKVNGVAKTEGTDYTIDATTGIVTFTVAPGAAATITWTGWYYTSVRFTKEFELSLNGIYGESTIDLIEVPFG